MDLTEATDVDLVSAAQAGDRRACGTLFARHRGLAMRLCQRMLGDTELVEDALQEASLQALLSLDRLRRPESFGAWFAGIAVHVCHRLLRSRSADELSLEALDGGRLAPELADSMPDLDDTVQQAELLHRVRGAVASLPAAQRTTVLLVYLGGFTQSEAANLLGVQGSAIKMRLHKARSRLRRDLVDAWEEFIMQSIPEQASGPRLVGAQVTDVRTSADGHPVVIVRETNGVRELWLVPLRQVEADAVAVALQGQRLPVWLRDEFVRSVAEMPPRTTEPGPWADIPGGLFGVRLTVRPDGTFASLLDARADDGSTSETIANGVHGVLRALVTSVPIQVEEQALERFARIRGDHAETYADPFGPGSVGASRVADAVFARWQRWQTAGPDWIPLKVVDVRLRPPDLVRHVVILQEIGGQRYLPIWVGQSEGAGLAVLVAGVETPRPFSLVLMGRLVEAAGGRVREIRIHRLMDQTFYAEIVVIGPNGEEVLDARPSDALAVGLHMGAPIYVAASVLELSAVTNVEPHNPPVATRIVEAIVANWEHGKRLTAAQSSD